MKKLLTLSVLVLTLAACARPPVAPLPVTEISVTGTYTYTIKATESVVSVNPGKVGTKFCYTDRNQTTEVCNNLVTGTRAVKSGYDLKVVFTEPDAPIASPAPALRR
ncbi:hypothetical protein [Deinococcus altitudinis]|uniref:hypothetical protein n=1 Tax=Deinococcus altitudinis TaxID=468914 RepID=UPI003891DE57